MMEVKQEDIIAIIEDAGVIADLDQIKSGSTLTDAGVDSLDLANVLLGIEEKYDIKIPDEDIDKLATVEAMVNYLDSRLK